MNFKNNIKFWTLIALTLLYVTTAVAQAPTQVVSGRVYDAVTHEPLIGAVLTVEGVVPQIGGVTDSYGFFTLNRVPLGRQTIVVKYIGYQEQRLSDILITAGKEVQLEVPLQEQTSQLAEVVIEAGSHKGEAVNSMALVGARALTVEEANRFAGGMDDPARLVSAYSGVTTGNIQDNSIIVRGNAPQGVAWRIEGVEVPSPHHFSGANVTGGGIVTMLSNFALANSDFCTGAFPAEFGQALAAVFDMRLRNGNSQRFEHAFEVGILGIDLSSEGPLSKKSRSSYLVNYRYSTIGLLSDLKVLPSDQLLKYQDLSFKLNFPTERAGTFTLWGLGGIDNTNKGIEEDKSKWEVDFDRIANHWDTYNGTLALGHKITLGGRGFLSTTLAYSGLRYEMVTQYVEDGYSLSPDMDLLSKTHTFTLSSTYQHKFSPRTQLRSGLYYRHTLFDYHLGGTQFYMPGTYEHLIGAKGYTIAPSLFAQIQHDFGSGFTGQVGLHGGYYSLNKEYLMEPRLSLAWQVSSDHALSLGYGMHSRPEALQLALLEIDGKTPNRSLRLSKAHHIVGSYTWQITRNLRLKAEAYFQYLYDIPGVEGSSFSMLNFKQNHTLKKVLVNNTIGHNYGLDLTLERFFTNQYYFLLTGSLFDAKYKGGDNVLSQHQIQQKLCS